VLNTKNTITDGYQLAGRLKWENNNQSIMYMDLREFEGVGCTHRPYIYGLLSKHEQYCGIFDKEIGIDENLGETEFNDVFNPCMDVWGTM